MICCNIVICGRVPMGELPKPTFISITQYNRPYYESGAVDLGKSSCGIFSLLSVHNFMADGDVSKTRHLQNVDSGVANLILTGLSRMLVLDETASQFQTAYRPGGVLETSTRMVEAGVIGIDHIFRCEGDFISTTEEKYIGSHRYAVIFEIRSSHFVVLVSLRSTDGVTEVLYSVRDCCKNEQYDVVGISALGSLLDTVYFAAEDRRLMAEFSELEDEDCFNLDSPIAYLVVDNEMGITKIKSDSYLFQSPSDGMVSETIDGYDFAVVGTEKGGEASGRELQIHRDAKMAMEMQAQIHRSEEGVRGDPDSDGEFRRMIERDNERSNDLDDDELDDGREYASEHPSAT